MAQRKHWTAEALAQVSNSTTTWANVATLTVPAAEQTAGATYVLFWSVELSSPSQVQDVIVRVAVNGVAGGEGRFDAGETMSPVDYSAPGGFLIFSAGAAPAAATFQLQFRSAAAGVACLAKRARLTLLALSALDAHVENVARQATTVRWSTAMQTAATLTFTPPTAGDYLILASALLDVAGFSTCEGYYDLYDGAQASARQGVYKREDTDVIPVVAMWRRDGLAGPQQIRLRWAADNYTTSAPTVGISEARIVALRLDRFDAAYAAHLAVTSEGADAADVDVLTLPGVVGASPHLTLAAWTTVGSNSPEETAFGSFVDNGTLVGEVVREPTGTSPYNNNGGWPAFVHRTVTYEAGARTWKLRRRSEATSISRMYAGAMIAVLDLGLPRAEARGRSVGTSAARARARAFHGRAGRAAGTSAAAGRRGWFAAVRGLAAASSSAAARGASIVSRRAVAAGAAVARALAFALRVASAPADRTWPVPAERRVFKVLNDETARGAEHFMSSAFNLDARGLYVVKDPDADLDYSLDWSEWVGEGDALATSEFTVAAGLTKGAVNRLGAVTTVWLSGGTLGETYLVTNRVETQAGRTEERSFRVRVRER